MALGRVGPFCMNARLMRGKLSRKYKKVMGSYIWFGGKEVNFKNWKVPELKKYLQARGISVSTKTGKN